MKISKKENYSAWINIGLAWLFRIDRVENIFWNKTVLGIVVVVVVTGIWFIDITGITNSNWKNREKGGNIKNEIVLASSGKKHKTCNSV